MGSDSAFLRAVLRAVSVRLPFFYLVLRCGYLVLYREPDAAPKRNEARRERNESLAGNAFAEGDLPKRALRMMR